MTFPEPTIIRAAHDGPYFSMARDTAQDRNLSFEARGVLAYLLSKPDDWEIRVSDLKQQCGKTKVYRIIDELKTAGYLEDRERIQKPDGTFAYTPYILHERPVTDGKKPCPENPYADKPQADEPHTDEPLAENRDDNKQQNPQKTEKQKTEKQRTDDIPLIERDDSLGRVCRLFSSKGGNLLQRIRKHPAPYWIAQAIDTYGEPAVCDCIERGYTQKTAEAERIHWAYIEGILKNWKAENGSEQAGSAASSPDYAASLEEALRPRTADEIDAEFRRNVAKYTGAQYADFIES